MKDIEKRIWCLLILFYTIPVSSSRLLPTFCIVQHNFLKRFVRDIIIHMKSFLIAEMFNIKYQPFSNPLLLLIVISFYKHFVHM